MTIAQALTKSTKILYGRSDSPRLDAEVLLSFVIDRSRTTLLTHSEKKLAIAQYRRFNRLIQRRKKQIPVPYLTGQCEFFGMQLRVSPAVLVPRPFTELLVESTLRHLPVDTTQTIVDVGTGSGAIALAVASERQHATVIGTDISSAALTIARYNAKTLDTEKRIGWRHGSLLEPLRHSDKPQVIIANLPYLTRRQLRQSSIRHEPRLALDGGQRGLMLIRRLLNQITNFSSIKLLALECEPGQVMTIASLLKRWAPPTTIERVHDGQKTRGLVAFKN